MPWTSSAFRNCLRILDDIYRRWRTGMYYVFYIVLTCIAIYRSRGVPVAKSWCNNHCFSNFCRLLSLLWRAPSLSDGKTTIRKDKKSGCHSQMNLLTKRFVASNVNYASRLRRSSDKKCSRYLLVEVVNAKDVSGQSRQFTGVYIQYDSDISHPKRPSSRCCIAQTFEASTPMKNNFGRFFQGRTSLD